MRTKLAPAFIALLILGSLMIANAMSGSPSPSRAPGYNAQCWPGNDPAPTMVINCDPEPVPSPVDTHKPVNTTGKTHRLHLNIPGL